ncbi:MAG: NAD(P)H-dependent oxidoreductase [Lachnospiraceae bacterium]|nr:NAD(P)H-dependent oxidoreductase [Lachnospiraceae bacterium]
MVLFVNACVRGESRTKRLADALIQKLNCEVTEVKLSEISFPIADAGFLTKRDSLIAAAAWSDPMFDLARQFAGASMIIIAAPYWDLSFPAALKQYFEQINVMGITFQYTPEGTPEPLCSAKKLYYVTTAGGAFVPEEFGFGYVKTMAQSFYGIHDVELIKAVGLDIDGADVEQIMNDSISSIPDLA